MAQRSRVDDRGRATESKFYLPAWGTPSLGASRVESLWAALFDHRV